MKKPAQVIIRKLTTIGLVFFAVSAVNPAAPARPRAAAIAFNHGDRDHHFDHGHRHFEFPYWCGASVDTHSPTFTIGGVANDLVIVLVTPGTKGFLTLQTANGATASLQ